MKVIVTEKPSAAKIFANVLGVPTMQKRSKDGKQDGYFMGGQYIITWCVGHLVGLAQPENYRDDWKPYCRKELPMVPNPWKYVVLPNTKAQFTVVQKLMCHEDVDTVICATDCGREGELIFHLVYQMSGSTKPVERLWISSMEDAVIHKGFQELLPCQEFAPLHQSALARLRADWLVGMNMSRLFTLVGGQSYHVGRVMSPTLAMVVERSEAIANFAPSLFYTVSLTTSRMVFTSEKIATAGMASILQEDCDGQTATITKIERVEKKTNPPKLFDLTTLQREANRQHGFTAAQTLDYAQSLYLKQLITYPRTDSRYVTEDMKDTVAILSTLLAPLVSHADKTCNVLQVVDNRKVADHHALLPTKAVSKYNSLSLPPGERAILHMITHRLVVSVANPHRYQETKMTAQCGKGTFFLKGRTTLDAGFTTLLPPPKTAPPSVPLYQEGDTFLVKAQWKEGQTSPPKHFTDDTLLAAMASAGHASALATAVASQNANHAIEETEIKGIGTPATRATVLEKLIEKGYMERVGKQRVKTIQPTDLGKRLIGLLPEELRSPVTTAQWEEQLQSIASGNLSPHRFLEEIIQSIYKILALYKDTADGALAEEDGKMVVGKCPRCGGNVVPNAKGYHCVRRDFSLWKNCQYFLNKKIDLTPSLAHQLLTMENVILRNCIDKKGRPYAVEIRMEDNGSNMDFKFIRFLNEEH